MGKFGVGIVEDTETGHELISVLTVWVESAEELDELEPTYVGEVVIDELSLMVKEETEVDAEEDEE